MLPDLRLGDKVKLRKPHPCGSYDWKVVRLGADIGIECLECGRRVILPRRQLARRIKNLLPPHKTEPETNGLSLSSSTIQTPPAPHHHAGDPEPAISKDELESN